MRNWKITKKLILGFMSVTFCAVVLSLLGIYATLTVNNNYTYLIDSPIARKVYLHDIQLEFMTMRYRTANYVMNGGDKETINGTLVPQYKAAYDEALNILNTYIENNNHDTRRSKDILEKNVNDAKSLVSMLNQFNTIASQVLGLALDSKTLDADLMLKSAIPLSGEINTLTSTMLEPAEAFVTETDLNMNNIANMIILVQLGTLCLVIIFALFFSLRISGIISKPVKFMENVLLRIGTQGNLSFTDSEYKQTEEYASCKDEIGESMHMLLLTVRRLVEVEKTLGAVANGNLTVELPLLSENDTMGISLQKMTDNLNKMFYDIHQTAALVAGNSAEIANGSQSLAQGSTEQAATVEELSSAIAEISHKTKENAAMTDRAATLASSIKQNAEKGSRQMDEMMTAVKDINQASQSINSVIKVINDIAFQTNILALNAAVEAARAGSAGKGFAVVADEVRNLASKSAEAAKNTEGLIANSMEKSTLGSRIAVETAESLSDIVSGINESNLIVSDIAQSSEMQALGIAEINKGIEQVAQVIQQNSATAEESAATSQELSGQSNILEEMIGKFKLRRK